MEYLIVTKSAPPFLTNWYNQENFSSDMIVYDLTHQRFTKDGKEWGEIEIDIL